jgi:DNA invertase Pin-like site-specific DNA recombinase
MALLGYARVSTQAQDLEPQLRQLRNAGCTEIFEEKASGTNRSRPELARLLERLRRGDTLVVVRIDRLARSLSHLLTVIERVRDAGGHFRSLGDPIDTAGPSGMLVLQIMGAIAQFERALIVERTKAGLAAARAQGRVGAIPPCTAVPRRSCVDRRPILMAAWFLEGPVADEPSTALMPLHHQTSASHRHGCGSSTTTPKWLRADWLPAQWTRFRLLAGC